MSGFKELSNESGATLKTNRGRYPKFTNIYLNKCIYISLKKGKI